MFCPKCGSQIPEGGHFCTKCGAAISQQPPIQQAAPQPPPPAQPQPVYQPPPPQPQPVYQPPPAYQQPTPPPVYQQPPVQYAVAQEHTSGMAITALIMGIIGFILSPLSVLAIIFGAIGIGQTSKNPYLKGKGLAVAGLILGIVNIVLWIILWVWIGSSLWWVFGL